MSKGLIITAHVEGIPHISLANSDFDQIICADGGLIAARAMNLKPTYYIGDFDSAEQPDTNNITVLPCRKDMTDTEAAITFAIEHGCDDITILGGLGGRFDHTMGNIGVLAEITGKISHIEILDGWNRVFMADPGTVHVERNGFKYLSLIAYGNVVEGLTLRNVDYPLDNFTLTNETSRTVSNEIADGCDYAIISHKQGRLLIIQSNDAD